MNQKEPYFFFCPSPLPFGGCTVLSLTRGPAGNRTTTGSLSAAIPTARGRLNQRSRTVGGPLHGPVSSSRAERKTENTKQKTKVKNQNTQTPKTNKHTKNQKRRWKLTRPARLGDNDLCIKWIGMARKENNRTRNNTNRHTRDMWEKATQHCAETRSSKRSHRAGHGHKISQVRSNPKTSNDTVT